MHRGPRLPDLTLACLLFLSSGTQALAQQPLHEKIDQLVLEGNAGFAAAVANDAEFFRRIHLDFTGVVPSSDETRQFLADEDPGKRSKLVRALAEGDGFARHIARAFDIILMERAADKHVPSKLWRAYLEESIRNNKPFNQLAKEILGADGSDEKIRAASKFYLDRDLEPNRLTREVGRKFFGVDLQCAQCHDHPLVDDYLQADYYGLYAFVFRGSLFQPDKKKKALIAEKADGDAEFKSVFTSAPGVTHPRVPTGLPLPDPDVEAPYKVKPAKNVRHVPTYSRMEQLGAIAEAGTNRQFNQNLANLLWFIAMGRGLTDPVDLTHSDNPPVHPKVLELLTDEVVRRKHDVKSILVELALSDTYQRSISLPSIEAARLAQLRKNISSWTSELEKNSAGEAALDQAAQEINERWLQLRKLVEQHKQTSVKAQGGVAAASKPLPDAEKKLKEQNQKLVSQKETVQVLQEAATKAEAVAKRLKDDGEIQKAAALFQTRVAAATESQKTIQTEFDKQQVAVNAIKAKIAEATKASDQAKAQWLAATKDSETTEEQYRAKSGELMRVRGRSAVLQKRVQFAQSAVRLLELDETFATARNQLDDISQKQAEAAERVGLRKTAFAAAQKQRGELAMLLDKSKTESEVAAKALAEAKATGQDLDTALQATLAALTRLPDDGLLVEISQKLKARSADYTAILTRAEEKFAAAAAKLKGMETQMSAADQQLNQLRDNLKVAEKLIEQLEQDKKQRQVELGEHQETRLEHLGTLAEDWSARFATRPLKPLSPEQFSWSIMRVTGRIDQIRKAAKAELDKKSPLEGDQAKDPKILAERELQIERLTFEKLEGEVNKFVRLFGAGAGQPQSDFFATVDQALFMANGGEIQSWLAPAPGSLTKRLADLSDPGELSSELYLAVLTREPSEPERRQVEEILAAAKESRVQAVQEMIWGLLTSSEFRFHH